MTGLRSILPYLATPLLGTWLATVRLRWCETHHLEAARRDARQLIYAFWHDSLLYFAWSHRGRGVQTLISRHADGQLVARAVELLGFRTSRGSSTRGGITALKEMIRAADHGQDFAITPDGPRGPRHRAQSGVLLLAARTGLPILPAVIAYENCHRVGSWDRMALPHPFTRAVCLVGESLRVHREDMADTKSLERSGAELEARLLRLGERATAEFSQLYSNGLKSARLADPFPTS